MWQIALSSRDPGATLMVPQLGPGLHLPGVDLAELMEQERHCPTAMPPPNNYHHHPASMAGTLILPHLHPVAGPVLHRGPEELLTSEKTDWYQLIESKR